MQLKQPSPEEDQAWWLIATPRFPSELPQTLLRAVNKAARFNSAVEVVLLVILDEMLHFGGKSQETNRTSTSIADLIAVAVVVAFLRTHVSENQPAADGAHRVHANDILDSSVGYGTGGAGE